MTCLIFVSAWLVRLADWLLSKSEEGSRKCVLKCCSEDVKILTVTMDRLEHMNTRLGEMHRALTDP